MDAEVERLNKEKESAVAEGDFERAAHLRDQADRFNRKKVKNTREWRKQSQASAAVDAQTVAAAVGAITGVPLGRPTGDAGARLLNMEEALNQAIVGKPEAVARVARAGRTSRAG